MIRSVVAYVVLAVAGIVTAMVGASAHRSIAPFGAILSIVLVVAMALFARSWKNWAGIGVCAGLWAVTTALLSLEGPGGSVLIAQDALGYSWLIGGTLAIMIVSMVPRAVLFGRADVG